MPFVTEVVNRSLKADCTDFTKTSKTYEDVSKKQRRQDLIALHTQAMLTKSRVNHLCHDNLALGRI